MKNSDYIASGEYGGEFYLIEKLGRNLFSVARHSDGKAFTRSYEGDGYKNLTGLRAAVKKHGEDKLIKVYANMGENCADWVPMYKARILRTSQSAQKEWAQTHSDLEAFYTAALAKVPHITAPDDYWTTRSGDVECRHCGREYSGFGPEAFDPLRERCSDDCPQYDNKKD